MDEKVIVDCGTGVVSRMPLTPDEVAQRVSSAADAAAADQSRKGEAARLDALLVKIAAQLTVSVDDLKAVFRLGSPGTPGSGNGPGPKTGKGPTG